MINKFALLVIGFDGYESLWSLFFQLLYKNWPDCPLKIYLVTNKLEPIFQNVEVITTHKNAEWSEKVRIALNTINEEYVIMLLEDFFICEKVNTQQVCDVLNFVVENKIQYLKMPYSGHCYKNKEKYVNYDNYYVIKKNERYGISLLPGLWEKKFLLDLIGVENYNPWKFEVDRLKEASKSSPENFDGCLVETRNVLKIYNGVIQGQFVPSTLKKIKKSGIIIKSDVIKPMKLNKLLALKIKVIFLKILPEQWHLKVKKTARKIGFKFVSDKWG